MKKNILVISIIIILIITSIYIYISNKEYEYICFNENIYEGTYINEILLFECTSKEKLPDGVITDKSELLTNNKEKIYKQTKTIYKSGDMLYKKDFILYDKESIEVIGIELLNEVEVLNHGTGLDVFTRYKTYIKNGKLYATNLNTNEEKLIFDTEEVKNIAIRSYCCTGEAKLLILTTSGNVYLSEKDCTYSFSFDFPFNKLEFNDIVSFKLIPEGENDLVKSLYGINSNGEEILLEKSTM